MEGTNKCTRWAHLDEAIRYIRDKFGYSEKEAKQLLWKGIEEKKIITALEGEPITPQIKKEKSKKIGPAEAGPSCHPCTKLPAQQARATYYLADQGRTARQLNSCSHGLLHTTQHVGDGLTDGIKLAFIHRSIS